MTSNETVYGSWIYTNTQEIPEPPREFPQPSPSDVPPLPDYPEPTPSETPEPEPQDPYEPIPDHED